MNLYAYNYIFIFLNSFIVVKSFQFEESTDKIFPSDKDTGVLSAYGHFDNDGFTDVIVVQGGNNLQLLKGSESQPYFQVLLYCSCDNMSMLNEVITGVIPGDFNGDSLLDILITSVKQKSKGIEVRVLWGKKDDLIDCKGESLYPSPLFSQPFVADFNGDMIPDIIAEPMEGNRFVWIYSSVDKNFTIRNLSTVNNQKLKNPHSSGLMDFNNDLIPDILMMGNDYIELWLNNRSDFVINDTIPYPKYAVYVWLSTFIDINMDGKSDLILPICYDTNCVKSAVMIWNTNDSQWITLLENFTNPNDNSLWGFKLPMGSALENSALPAMLRYGDVNMDGYTDFLTVLQSKSKATDLKAVILKNVPCTCLNCNCINGRTLEIVWDIPRLNDIQNIQLATFFDLFEDGVLDILISTKKGSKWNIHAFINKEVFDSCFLKVLVLNGLHNPDCSNHSYGVNQPGPIVQYNMTKQDGNPVVSSAIQLSQSAHFPLQLPYLMFGLGPTPNFIDVLTVSVIVNQTIHKRDWVQIIPNSQIVVIPYPPNDPNKWVKKLFVTPSQLVLWTGISLVGTCIFISLLVGVLQWKERREDKKEKMQDAYRFHFDAM